MLYILTIHHQSKFARVPLILSGPKAHQGLALASYPVSSVKNSRKGGKCKISGFYNRLFLIPRPHQGWRPMTDISRLTAFLLVERFKWKLQSSSGPQIPGEWVSCQTFQAHTFSFPSSKLKEFPNTVLRVDNKSGEVRTQPT